jgi:TatD DNase family protein
MMRHNSSMLIDSHCHLDHYRPDEIDAMLARAAAAGVGEVVTIGTRLARADEQFRLAEAYPNVWCTVGTHPHNAAEQPVPQAEDIAALAAHRRCIGIGEAGLDYFYDKAPRPVQQECLRAHVQAAALSGLPLVIHARDADDDMINILQNEWNNGVEFKFLLHCFSSGPGLAEAGLALGGYFSFSGMLTFPKSFEIREIAAKIPLDRLLVETDAPYLAPVPMRGKRNEPAWVAHTARVLAEVKGLTPEALAAQTTANFRRLFAKAPPASAPPAFEQVAGDA